MAADTCRHPVKRNGRSRHYNPVEQIPKRGITMSHHVPLNELAVAVQSAVEQVLGKHGAVPIDKLWVGFVAPDTIANEANAQKIAAALGKQAGVHTQAAVAQEVIAAHPGGQHAAPATAALPRPGHIIGLVFNPKV
jgi:hypothetical protein